MDTKMDRSENSNSHEEIIVEDIEAVVDAIIEEFDSEPSKEKIKKKRKRHESQLRKEKREKRRKDKAEGALMNDNFQEVNKLEEKKDGDELHAEEEMPDKRDRSPKCFNGDEIVPGEPELGEKLKKKKKKKRSGERDAEEKVVEENVEMRKELEIEEEAPEEITGTHDVKTRAKAPMKKEKKKGVVVNREKAIQGGTDDNLNKSDKRKKKLKKRAEQHHVEAVEKENLDKFMNIENSLKERSITNECEGECDYSAEEKEKRKNKTKRKQEEKSVVDVEMKKKKNKGKKAIFSDEDLKGKNEKKVQDDENRAGASGQDCHPMGGKRFTKEEDEALKTAVSDYIRERGFAEDKGLHMILNCMKNSDVRNCWKQIAASLPWRPVSSVYFRAHVLYGKEAKPSWSEEEINTLKRLHTEYGNKWKKISELLGKSSYDVKNKWRRVKREGIKSGRWSQDEYEKLFDLVNQNLELKSSKMEEKPSKKMLRDNINWESIADRMGTRNHVSCCKKWYSLQSSMIRTGEWQNADDITLLRSLLETNASAQEAVDWNALVEGRSDETSLKRWTEMVKHLGECISKPFLEKLEILVKRYIPKLIE